MSSPICLADLGWNDFFDQAFRSHAESALLPMRVTIHHRGAYELVGDAGVWTAEVSGRFRHETRSLAGFPTVGDWVLVDPAPGDAKGIIQAILPRATKFSRTSAGNTSEEQVLAANIDQVLIVASLSCELNQRRIERYLTLAWESGATPCVVLTKRDACPDLKESLARVQSYGPKVRVHAISNLTGEGLPELEAGLQPCKTSVLLGPSGVGKSTLINRLCGDDLQDVGEVRATDQKGKHTTTRRELIRIPSGALIIDTPGLRELELWEASEGIDETFPDLDELAKRCRFDDCTHESEPGCALRSAVKRGKLDEARLRSFQKLRRESIYVEQRQSARAVVERKRLGKLGAKSLRAFFKTGVIPGDE